MLIGNGRMSELVAPFAGAWIEIFITGSWNKVTDVAPFAGAWIEIFAFKYGSTQLIVAPFAGAWIEIGIPFIFD